MRLRLTIYTGLLQHKCVQCWQASISYHLALHLWSSVSPDLSCCLSVVVPQIFCSDMKGFLYLSSSVDSYAFLIGLGVFVFIGWILYLAHCKSRRSAYNLGQWFGSLCLPQQSGTLWNHILKRRILLKPLQTLICGVLTWCLFVVIILSHPGILGQPNDTELKNLLIVEVFWQVLYITNWWNFRRC